MNKSNLLLECETYFQKIPDIYSLGWHLGESRSSEIDGTGEEGAQQKLIEL